MAVLGWGADGRAVEWRDTGSGKDTMILASVLALCLATHAFGHLAWLLADEATARLIFAEDRLVEMVSAAVFLLASVVAAFAASDRRRGAIDRLFLAGLAFLGLLGCLDEISFGERLIRFEAPEIAGIKIDGAHDFIEVANTVRRELFGPVSTVAKVAIVVAALASFAGLLFTIYRLRRHLFPLGALWLRRSILLLAFAFGAELGIAALVDIRVAGFEGDQAFEEVAEMNAAIILAGMATIGVRSRADLQLTRHADRT